MESHNLKIVTFAETIRKQMQLHKPPLIRHRRLLPLFRNYPDVFYGCDAVIWAMKSLSTKNKDVKSDFEAQGLLSESQAVSLFQKLMDAGLLLNVTTQEQFKNNRSLFRFSSDHDDAEKLIRSVAIGYRIYDSAQSSATDMFQKVCSLGQLVSCECLKSSDIVTWLLENGMSLTRDEAVSLSQDMVDSDVLKPVDSEVQKFADGKDFYMFAIDYKQPPLTVDQFLNCSLACPQESSSSNDNMRTRNKNIHLRQTSDQVVSTSHLSACSINKYSGIRKKGISSSSDDSGFDDISLMTSSYTSFRSLLNDDGSMTRAALLHPAAPFKKKNLWILPDPVGYGFVIRGTGPCFVKIVDPDSPAGKAGLKANQFIVFVNRNDVTSLHHTAIENMILSGPKFLKITVMQSNNDGPVVENSNKTKEIGEKHVITPVRQRSCPPFPTAQPWIKKREPNRYNGMRVPSLRQVVSQ